MLGEHEDGFRLERAAVGANVPGGLEARDGASLVDALDAHAVCEDLGNHCLTLQ
jgi:hypothetical protein